MFLSNEKLYHDKPAFGGEIQVEKVMRLISGIIGILCGIAIIILAILDVKTPKILWLVFALCSFINAILILHCNKFWNKDKK